MTGDEPMRILMTTDTVGGVWTYAVELACALRDRGAAVTLAAMGRPLSVDQSNQIDALDLDVRPRVCKLEWMDDPWDDVQAAGHWLMELDRELSPDVVHLNHFAHAGWPWSAPVVMTVHSCVCTWWRAVHGQPAPAVWQRYRRMAAASIDAADAVVTPTAAMADMLHACYQPGKTIHTILNGRAAALFPPAPTKEPMLFAAGRWWDEAKNLAILRDMTRDLPWPLFIAGDGIEHLDHGCGHSLGTLAQPQIARWMAKAAIYVAPARYEPFGLSILEAALAGCALVLGDIPTLREVWADAAIFADPTDARHLQVQIASLIAGASRRRKLARAARHRAQQLTPQRMAQAYHQLYQQITQPAGDGDRPRPLGARLCAS